MTREEIFRPRDWGIHPVTHDSSGRAGNPLMPQKPPVSLAGTVSELTGPIFRRSQIQPDDSDLVRNGVVTGPPIGSRIVVAGRVTDEAGQPMPDVLVEMWQANAAGRYANESDRDDAPLDPNFSGVGRCMTDREGRYSFRTIRPGNYPAPSAKDRWRPAHIHFSLYGPSILSRLVTQLYFADDPILPTDRVLHSVSDEAARNALIARYSPDVGEPGRALGYRFDIVLRDCHFGPQED